MVMKGGLLLAGIGTLVMLILLLCLSPLFNTIVTEVLNNTNDPVANILIQLLLPLVALSLVFAVLYSRGEASESTVGRYFSSEG